MVAELVLNFLNAQGILNMSGLFALDLHIVLVFGKQVTRAIKADPLAWNSIELKHFWWNSNNALH